MINVTLTRLYYLPDCVIGMLQVDDQTLFTMEPAWLGNQHEISCVPVGVYMLTWRESSKHGNVFELANVPDRTDIEIHPGNYPQDTQGCILIGERVEAGEHGAQLVDSVNAWTRFNKYVRGKEPAYLRITNGNLGGQT